MRYLLLSVLSLMLICVALSSAASAQISSTVERKDNNDPCSRFTMRVVKPSPGIEYKLRVAKPAEGVIYRGIVVNPCLMEQPEIAFAPSIVPLDRTNNGFRLPSPFFGFQLNSKMRSKIDSRCAFGRQVPAPALCVFGHQSPTPMQLMKQR